LPFVSVIPGEFATSVFLLFGRLDIVSIVEPQNPGIIPVMQR
jgi:hypothetical protein